MKHGWERIVGQDGAVALVLWDRGQLVEMQLLRGPEWRFAGPNKLQLMCAGAR